MRLCFRISDPTRLIALVCVLALGIAAKAFPDAGDIAGNQTGAPVETLDTRSHGALDYAQSGPDHPEIGGHCHPGLDCSLTAVMSDHERASFWRQLIHLSVINPGHHLTSFIQVDDPPPPRGSVLM